MNFKDKKEECEFIGGLSEFCLRNGRVFNWDTLKDYLDSLVPSLPLPSQSTTIPSRPFERGDRVRWNDREGDVIAIIGHLTIQKDNGETICISSPFQDVTLVTPASAREIKVGDTVSCSCCNREFMVIRITDTALGIKNSVVWDENNGNHFMKDCTFRSRPHKPEPTLSAALKWVEEVERGIALVKERLMEKADRYCKHNQKV